MGVGVAHSLAQNGRDVVMVDLNEEILGRAEAQIRQDVRFQGMFNREARANPDEIMSRIRLTRDADELAASDFVVENVTENWEIKRPVYSRLDAICRPEVVFGVNTSCIPITKVGAATKRAAQVIGIHFMNPVPLKTTVEVIRGYHTSEETIETTRHFLSDMGKECIVVNDQAGFVSNRVLMLTINEAICVVHEQVATAEEVDQIFKRCIEHKMGPLETGDLIGLDTILFSLEVLYESYNDPKFRPCPLLRKMVDAGLCGRKSGQGFFSYAV
jgi:3-hydroxybutyryl-CoA dehydrogenase